MTAKRGAAKIIIVSNARGNEVRQKKGKIVVWMLTPKVTSGSVFAEKSVEIVGFEFPPSLGCSCLKFEVWFFECVGRSSCHCAHQIAML